MFFFLVFFCILSEDTFIFLFDEIGELWRKPTELLMNIRGGGLGKGRGEMRGNINK